MERRIHESAPSRVCMLIGTIALGTALVVPATAAAAVTVNTTADLPPSASECLGAPGDCSLRRALDAAAATDTIVVPASNSPYKVRAGQLLVNKNLTISGAGADATVIDARRTSRVFHVVAPSTAATFSGLTITRGKTSGSGPLFGGAGIRNDAGALTVTDSVFLNNSVSATGGCCNGGGAIWDGGSGMFSVSGSRFSGNRFAASALAADCCNGGGAIYDNGGAPNQDLSDDTFTGNTASLTGATGGVCCKGGGAYFNDGGSLSISGSTFDGNKLSIGGDSIESGGGAVFHDGGDFTVSNSTLTRNEASPLGGASNGGGAILYQGGSGVFGNDTIAANSTDGAGGGILSLPTIAFQSTILAGGSAATGPNCAALSAAPAFVSGGYNLESADSCGFHATGDHPITKPMLEPLASNGGPTPTMALPLLSPAVDMGAGPGLVTDQRGRSRPFDFLGIANPPGEDGSDIGAFELRPSDIPSTFSFGRVKKNKAKGTARLTVTVPGPGRLVLAGNGLVRQRRPSSAGKVKLKVRPEGKKKRVLNRTGKVKVKAKVTYSPTGGQSNAKVKRIKLVKRR